MADVRVRFVRVCVYGFDGYAIVQPMQNFIFYRARMCILTLCQNHLLIARAMECVCLFMMAELCVKAQKCHLALFLFHTERF